MRVSEPAPNSKTVNKWAQNRRRELGLRGCAHSAGKRAAISDPKAGSRPDLARLRQPRFHLRVRGRHCVFVDRRGGAVPFHGNRLERPHSGGLVALGANGGRHRGVGRIARMRGSQRHIQRRQ